jgi:Bifunctional DNA primase/polymerase, N-terminal
MNLSQNALDYATRGWSVFPCKPRTKEPACPRGFYAATTNPATIRRWWFADATYNIGIRTGIASGVWVFDIDGDGGATAVGRLEAEHGPLPETLTSVTSNGCHLWFRYDSPISCNADGRVGRCLDVRGDGGYVLAPPSLHPEGPRYRWTNDRPLATAPGWLIKLTRKQTISERAIATMRVPLHRGGGSHYGQAALEYEIAKLAHTPPGSRNHALNKASFALHQLVAGDELNAAEVRARLVEAATANGLMSDPDDGPRSVMATIASGARAGLLHPRNRRGAS